MVTGVRPSAPRHPGWLVAIFAGGSLGTALRAWLEAQWPPPTSGVPWTTFAINIAGSLLLGVLLETLAERGPDRGLNRALRLGLGTGALGGFTTYSTFAVESVRLIEDGPVGVGIGYAVLSVVVGALAAFGGVHAVRQATSGRGRT